MAWNVAPYDAATVMRRSGCDSTESLMTMFRARSFPPLRVFDACTTAIPSKRTYCSLLDHNEAIGEDDTLFAADDSPHHVEKKKRLTTSQVRSLEVSFESDNRLEPERKQQLADQLGLQPRQVAVWFQNRRARWKTKRLEHDYDVLKADYDAVVVERDRLRAEIVRLTAKLQARGGKGEGNDVEESQEQHLIEAIGGPNEEMLLHEPDSHGIPAQVLDHLSPQAAESLALNNNDSPVSSDCSDILDEGSPNPIDTSIEQMPPYPQLVKVEYDDSACISSVVGYPQVYQQLAVKVEEGLLLEESNLNLFSVDEHELQWLWLN